MSFMSTHTLSHLPQKWNQQKEALYTPWSEVTCLNSVSLEPESLPHMEINDVPIFKHYKWDLKKNIDKVFHSYECLNTFFTCLYLFIFAFVNLELNLLASLPSTVWLRCHHFVKFSLLSLYVKKRKYNLKQSLETKNDRLTLLSPQWQDFDIRRKRLPFSPWKMWLGLMELPFLQELAG